MRPAADSLGLDQAWVYGLIRQESRFISSARSYVGAQGLMQIMPGTAKFIAHKIGMEGLFACASRRDRHQHHARHQLPEHHLQRPGQFAGAGYGCLQCGPGRPRTWRASLNSPVEGAIFAETIPFNETREYVRNVMSNATYYAALFENRSQSLKARLGVIVPKGYVASDIPNHVNRTCTQPNSIHSSPSPRRPEESRPQAGHRQQTLFVLVDAALGCDDGLQHPVRKKSRSNCSSRHLCPHR